MAATISTLDLAIQAGPFIHQRYNGIDFTQYLTLLTSGSFNVRGASGAMLTVHHLLPSNWAPFAGILSVTFQPALQTITGTHITINNRPVYRLSDGSILVVFDQTTSGWIPRPTRETFMDPQLEVTGEKRYILKGINESNASPSAVALSFVRQTRVKRPANAFILFRTDNLKAIKAQCPEMGNNDLSKVLGRMWQDSSEEAKDVYKARARQLADQHKQKHPQYKYTPRRSSEIIRRMGQEAGILDNSETGKDGDENLEESGPSTPQGIVEQNNLNLGELLQQADRVLEALGVEIK